MSVTLVNHEFGNLVFMAKINDTWASIAEAFETSESALKKENRVSHQISEGEYFAVPKVQTKFHIVQPTETISSICEKYGVSEQDLRAANEGNIFLFVGKKIFLP